MPANEPVRRMTTIDLEPKNRNCLKNILNLKGGTKIK